MYLFLYLQTEKSEKVKLCGGETWTKENMEKWQTEEVEDDES